MAKSTPTKSMREHVPQYLHTPRLVLELFNHSPEHYACLLGSINNPTAYARLGDFGIRTPTQFDALNTPTRLHAPYNQGLTADLDFYYVLRLGAKDGEMMGGVSLAQRGANVPPDMGWCLLEAFHGKGYATEAAREFLRYVREEFGCRDVITWPGNKNKESRRVAEKLGFVRAGTVKAMDGGEEDDIVYALPGMDFKVDGLVLNMYGDDGKAE